MAQKVKNPPAMQETQVWSLGHEDPLEKEMTTHSSILEEPGRLQSMGLQRVRLDWATNTKVYNVMMWYTYILWNDYHNEVS